MLDEAGEEGIVSEGVGEEARNFRFMMMRVIFKSVCDTSDRCLRNTERCRPKSRKMFGEK